MTGLPADPFRTGDAAADALREGATVLAALEGCAADEGRNLILAVTTLEREDLHAALLVAVIERHVQRRGWFRRRAPRVLRLVSFRRESDARG